MSQLDDAAAKRDMQEIAAGLPSKSSKIRALAAAGYARADIARFLDIRYQHVRNVLIRDEEKAATPSSADEEENRNWAKLGPGGRVVIPANYRQALGIKEGDSVQLRCEDDEIRMVPRDVVIRRVQDTVRQHVPEGVSLVDELIADRRRETEKEASD